MNKNILAGVGVALAAVLVLVVALKPVHVTVDVPAQESFQAGSATSPDISSPYFSFGGVREWATRTETLNQASTTICAMQSPAATTTLVQATVGLLVSSTTASNVVIAKSVTAFATTTLLAQLAVAANAQVFVIATNTIALLTPDGIMPPSTWIVASMSGGTGTFSPTGICKAVFREL